VPVITFLCVDGQSAATRLSNHLKKATRAMKDLTAKFNALGASSHSAVELSDLLDPQSPIYSGFDSFDQVMVMLTLVYS